MSENLVFLLVEGCIEVMRNVGGGRAERLASSRGLVWNRFPASERKTKCRLCGLKQYSLLGL